MKKYLFLFFAVFYVSVVSAQTEIFVSSVGNDRAAGTFQKPFATLEKAVSEARKAKGEKTVFLRGGDYRLSSAIILTPADSNLTIRSYTGEKAVLKGSVELKKIRWEEYNNDIFKAKVNLSGFSDFICDMLFVDGEIRHQARFPNYDSAAVRFNGTSVDATSRERIRTWKNPSGGYLHAMHAHDWGDFHYRIAGVDSTGSLILEGGHQNNRQMGLHRENRMVENIFEELDAEGEWFYNADENLLYCYPL